MTDDEAQDRLLNHKVHAPGPHACIPSPFPKEALLVTLKAVWAVQGTRGVLLSRDAFTKGGQTREEADMAYRRRRDKDTF